MIEYNDEHLTHKEYWDFMRDSWMGQNAIVHEATRNPYKYYLHRGETISDLNFGYYARSGRYPELISRLLRMSVERTLLREPQGMEALATISDDPDKLLRWALTQVGLVGSCGMALSFDKDRTRTAMFNTEGVINWSSTSIAFEDVSCKIDDFGFAISDKIQQKIYHVEDFGTLKQRLMVTVIDPDEGVVANDMVLNKKGGAIKNLAAVRITTDNKPLFYSLAQSCLKYYQTSAHRNFILHQIIPQPVLYLPPSDSPDSTELSELYSDGNINIGLGTLLKLPHSAKFEIVSPVIRSLSEMRQELMLIKDEMVIQGAQPYFQKAGQVNTLNDASIRMHTDDQVMTFSDVVNRVEKGINHLLAVSGENDNVEKDLFKFKLTDFDPKEIEDFVDSYVGTYDKNGEPFDDKFTEMIVEELAQRGIVGDQ